MKSLLLFIAGAVTATSLAGCRSQQALPVETRTTVTERLVEVQTPADSAWLQALLECDENNRVLLRSMDERKTSGMQSELQITQEPLSGKSLLRYAVIRVPEKIYVPAKDSIVFKETQITVTANALTGWQWFQIWAGRLLLLLFIIYIAIRILTAKLTANH